MKASSSKSANVNYCTDCTSVVHFFQNIDWLERGITPNLCRVLGNLQKSESSLKGSQIFENILKCSQTFWERSRVLSKSWGLSSIFCENSLRFHIPTMKCPHLHSTIPSAFSKALFVFHEGLNYWYSSCQQFIRKNKEVQKLYNLLAYLFLYIMSPPVGRLESVIICRAWNWFILGK